MSFICKIQKCVFEKCHKDLVIRWKSCKCKTLPKFSVSAAMCNGVHCSKSVWSTSAPASNRILTVSIPWPRTASCNELNPCLLKAFGSAPY